MDLLIVLVVLGIVIAVVVTRSQRGRSSGVGRRFSRETPMVASMFSPSTRTNVRFSAMERSSPICQPPATAGSTTTWSPSLSAASSPPMKRTSSSLT